MSNTEVVYVGILAVVVVMFMYFLQRDRQGEKARKLTFVFYTPQFNKKYSIFQVLPQRVCIDENELERVADHLEKCAVWCRRKGGV